MRKSQILFGTIVAVIVLIGFFIYAHADIFKKLPLNNTLSFVNISCVESDEHEQLIVIDQSMKRLIRTSPSGVLTSVINCPVRENNTVLFADVVTDQNGSFYVLNTVLDDQGYYVESEEINRYTPEGSFDKLLYRVEYAEEDRPIRVGWMKSLDIRNGFLYFYSVGHNKATLNKMALSGDTIENVFSIDFMQEMFIAEIDGLDFGAVFFTTKKGEIYKINESGKPVLLYSSGSGVKSLPVYLGADAQQRVYFVDVYREEVSSFNAAARYPAIETILSESELWQQGHDFPFSVLKDLNVKQDGSLIVVASDHVICTRPDGAIKLVLNQAVLPLKMVMFQIIVWLSALLALILLFYAGKILYVDIMHKKVSLIFKQLCFIPVIIISMVFVAGVIYTNYSKKYEAEIYSKLTLLAHIGTQSINTGFLAGITTPEHFLDSNYKGIKENVNSIYRDIGSADGNSYYYVIYKLEEGKLYWCITDDDSISPFYPFNIQNNDYYKVIADGQYITGRESDAEGQWMYAVGPLINAEGKIVGAFETGMDLIGFTEHEKELFRLTGKSIAVATVVIIILFLLMTYYLLLSIRILRKGVNEMASGNWDVSVSVTSRDEVADLCDGFNKMAAYIRKYISDITVLNDSYLRFVPQQLVHFLKKESIVDVHLGDQVKQEMSILFSNVRSFNLISKSLTPEESFALINAYLKRVGPVIRKNGGFVDRYAGNGIVALFPGTAGEALKAAVDMRKELEIFNAQRNEAGYYPIDIGIGIHRGPLMLGIIGEKKRMEGTVISDNVDLTAIIEKKTEKFGASILVTENMLSNATEQYLYRLLGFVQVDVKEEPVQLFDLFHGDPEDIKKLKLETKDLFEEGITLYRDGRFYDARSRFVEVVRYNFRDEAAKIYFFLCDEYYKNGAPEGWKGTLPA